MHSFQCHFPSWSKGKFIQKPIIFINWMEVTSFPLSFPSAAFGWDSFEGAAPATPVTALAWVPLMLIILLDCYFPSMVGSSVSLPGTDYAEQYTDCGTKCPELGSQFCYLSLHYSGQVTSLGLKPLGDNSFHRLWFCCYHRHSNFSGTRLCQVF